MKIVHVNSMELDGGAARAAHRVHDGLLRLGYDSHMFVQQKASEDTTVREFAIQRDPWTQITRNIRRLRLRREMQQYLQAQSRLGNFFSDDRTYHPTATKQIPQGDIVNFHWIAEFIDYGAFFKWLPPGMPLVWTLHDMAPMTGGCHYDMGCGKFTAECGACPQLGSAVEKDLSREIWHRKKNHYASLIPGQFHVVTPSQWLGKEASRSSLLGKFPRSVIPYGLDLDVFQPRDKKRSRENLGIPEDARVALFVAQNIADKRKGFHLLVEALAGIESNQNIFIVSLGLGSPAELRRFPYKHVEAVADDRILSEIYSAADVFVAPSLADNLPNTVLESMACGTPVVAFKTGGLPDMIQPGVTGILAATGDATDLRRAILQVLGDDALRATMSANCRRIAEEEYDLSIQARRYVKLYEEMLNKRV